MVVSAPCDSVFIESWVEGNCGRWRCTSNRDNQSQIQDFRRKWCVDHSWSSSCKDHHTKMYPGHDCTTFLLLNHSWTRDNIRSLEKKKLKIIRCTYIYLNIFINVSTSSMVDIDIHLMSVYVIDVDLYNSFV